MPKPVYGLRFVLLAAGGFSTLSSVSIAQSTVPGPRPRPLVAYTEHTQRPFISDMRVMNAEFGLIGALASMKEGSDIANQYDIVSPSGTIAGRIAASYAAEHNAALLAQPIAIPNKFTTNVLSSSAAQRPRYVVDADDGSIRISYEPLNWNSFDIVLSEQIRIYDTQYNVAIAQTRCSVRGDHSDNFNHDQLLADSAKELKMLIRKRGEQCVAQIEAKLGLADVPQKPTTVLQSAATQPSIDWATPQPLASSDPDCDADKARAAVELGVPCSALGGKVAFPVSASQR